MMRFPTTSALLSLLLVAAPLVAAGAQANGIPASDSLPAATHVDSAQSNRSWLVALLRKIARRSDEASADTSAYAADDVTAESPARSARRVHACGAKRRSSPAFRRAFRTVV